METKFTRHVTSTDLQKIRQQFSSIDNGDMLCISTDIGLDMDDLLALLVAIRYEKEKSFKIEIICGGRRMDEMVKYVGNILREIEYKQDIPTCYGTGILNADMTDENVSQMYPRIPQMFWPGVNKVDINNMTILKKYVENKSKNYDDVIVTGGGVQRIVDLANTYAGKLIIVSLGSRTDIADALKLDSNIAKKIKRIILSGGFYLNDDGTVKRTGFNDCIDMFATNALLRICIEYLTPVLMFNSDLNIQYNLRLGYKGIHLPELELLKTPGLNREVMTDIILGALNATADCGDLKLRNLNDPMTMLVAIFGLDEFDIIAQPYHLRFLSNHLPELKYGSIDGELVICRPTDYDCENIVIVDYIGNRDRLMNMM